MIRWAHHVTTRWTEAFRSPGGCVTGFGAAFMLTGTPVTARGLNGIYGLAFIVPTFLLATWFVAASGAGRNSSRNFPSFATSVRNETTDIPFPALPLDPGVRALAEAVAGLGVLALWQTLLVATAPLSESLLSSDIARSVFIRSLSGTIATWCVLMPGALAWLLPARSHVVNLLRGGAVTIATALAFQVSLTSMPLAIEISVAMVAALLATARVATIPGPFTGSRAGRQAVMFRSSRSSLAQLCRDACLGPLRSSKLPLIVCATAFVLLGALARADIVPELLASVVVTMVPLLVTFWLAVHPLGTSSTTVGRGVRTGGFSADVGPAWTTLPLRREWVMRAFYFHGTMTGFTFIALSRLAMEITGSPPVFAGGNPGEPFSLTGCAESRLWRAP